MKKTQEIKAEEEVLATNSCQVGDKWSHFLGCNIDSRCVRQMSQQSSRP